jgi:hypothetical protein
MFNKVFRIAERDLRPILAVTGACLATDRIVVNGCEVCGNARASLRACQRNAQWCTA